MFEKEKGVAAAFFPGKSQKNFSEPKIEKVKEVGKETPILMTQKKNPSIKKRAKSTMLLSQLYRSIKPEILNDESSPIRYNKIKAGREIGQISRPDVYARQPVRVSLG